MRKLVLGTWLIVLSLGAVSGQNQSVPVLKFDQLNQLINQPNDTLYIVNFWATWCAPCVKELPLFDAVRQAYATKKVQVLLVSMDDILDLNQKVKPFIRKRNVQSRVILLDEPDLNTWVDQLVPEWSGALPMTLILNKHRTIRQYIGKSVKAGELESIINQYKL